MHIQYRFTVAYIQVLQIVNYEGGAGALDKVQSGPEFIFGATVAFALVLSAAYNFCSRSCGKF